MKNHSQFSKQPNLGMRDDELSLRDVLDFLKQAWRWLAAGATAGLIGAVGLVLITPSQYEVTAVIQPATVGLPTTTTTTTTKGADVEPVVQTLERLKIATFYTSEMVQVCQVASAHALASGLKPSLVKGNSLIQLNYRATSKAEAEACVNAVVARLAKSQSMIVAPIIKTLEEQLAQSRLRLREAKEFQAQLEKRAASADTSSLLMLSALAKREEIEHLQKQILELEVQLSAPLTQPLQLLEPIYASEWPVATKRLSTLAGGVFGGLVLGGLAFFARRSWQVRQA